MPRGLLCTLAALVVVGIILLCPWVGPEVAPDQFEFVFWKVRVPRVAMATLVGMVLGIVALPSTIFRMSSPRRAPSGRQPGQRWEP